MRQILKLFVSPSMDLSKCIFFFSENLKKVIGFTSKFGRVGLPYTQVFLFGLSMHISSMTSYIG